MKEDNKTIIDYIGQIFANFGVMILILMALSFIVGDQAKPYSRLFAMADQGLSFETLSQLLLLAVIISLGEILFLTVKWIKNLSVAVRIICFLLMIFITVVIFSIVFSWFPVKDIRAWIGFLLSFSICTAISTAIAALNEKMENKKMEEALKRFHKKR